MIDSKMMPMPRGGKVTQVPTLESPDLLPGNGEPLFFCCGYIVPSEDNEISKKVKMIFQVSLWCGAPG